jgi:nucleolar protein 15
MSKLIKEAGETRKRVRAISKEETPIEKTKQDKKSKKVKEVVVEEVKEEVVSSSKQRVSKRAANKKIQAEKQLEATKIANKVEDKGPSNIIYLGHIPDGFYENEMKKFFVQFGEVKRVKLFRSEKTNNSKGYAFIQFIQPEVASTVATAMNGYLMMDRSLVSNVIPRSKCHNGMFKPPKGKMEKKVKKV